MKRFFTIIGVLLILVFLVTSCGKSTTTTTPASSPSVQPSSTPTPTKTVSATPTPTQKSGGTFKFITYQTDPSEGGWPADTTGANAYCYEALMEQEISGDMVPWLASSWDIASDYTSITFHLQKGVKFSDGSDFNADAVKFNYQSEIDAKKVTNWSSMDVIDENTIRVNVINWQATTLQDFGGYVFCSPTAYNTKGLDWLRKNPVGTGPFLLQKFTQDAEYDYVKNPNYWRKGEPYIDAFDIIIITDSATQENAMKAGEGDATIAELGKMTADFKNMGLQIATQVQAVFCLVPDTMDSDSPWANQKVREAAEYAIDKDAIATGMGYGLWQAPYQVPPRGNAVWEQNPPVERKFDLDKAKQLMIDAGYPDGFDTSIIPFPGATSRDVTMAVVGDLAKIGIRATPDYVEFGAYLDYNNNGWHNGVLFAPVPAYPYYIQTLNTLFDPDNSLLYKKGWQRSPAFLAALKAANNVKTPDINLTRAVTDLWMTEATVIPVYEGGKSYAYQSYVKDAGFLTRGFPTVFNWEALWLDK